MFHHFPSFPAFTISILTLVILFSYWKKSRVSNLKFPPGPPKLPLIGNLHQLKGSLPHQTIATFAKKYGPIMHLQLGELIVVVISSPEAAKEVLKTNEISFAQRPEVLATDLMSFDHSSFIFAPYEDYWRQSRKICVLELLSAKRVQSSRSIREEEVWDFIESISLSEGVPVNLSQKLFSMTSNVTSRAAFGLKSEDQDEFIPLLHEAMRITAGFNLSDFYPSIRIFRYLSGLLLQPVLEKIHKKLERILDDMINKRKEKIKLASFDDETDQENVLDVLIKFQESNQLEMQLTNNQIKAVTMDIFSAGTESSATTLEWAMSELLKNPRVMEKAQKELRQALNGKTKRKKRRRHSRSAVPETSYQRNSAHAPSSDLDT